MISNPITDRQAAFAEAFARHGELRRAALDAGYAPGGAHVRAYENFRNPRVLLAIMKEEIS